MGLIHTNFISKWSAPIALLFCNILVLPLNAAAWEVEPSLYFSVSHNDNVFLSPDGQEKSDFITQLNPNISVARQGKRSYLEADYTMQNVRYADESAFNDTFHSLNSRAGSEIVRDVFYIDATAGRTQQLTTRDTAVPADNVTISSNRTNLDLYSVSPYLRQQLGRQAMAEVRYSKRWNEYESASAIDSSEEQYHVDLRSTQSQQLVRWAVIYDHRKILPDTDLDSRLEEELLDLSIRLTGKLDLLLAGGYEHNEYEYASGLRVEKGKIWNAGLRVISGHGLELTGRYGERFFGKTSSYRLISNGRKWRIRAEYEEELRTSAGILFLNQTENELDEDIVQAGDPLPGTELFLNEELNINITRIYGKTELAVEYYDRDRIFRTSNNTEHIYGGEADIFWRFLPRTRLNIGYSQQREKISLNSSTDKLTQYRLGVNRQIRERAFFSVQYRNYKRDTDNPLRNNFTQNQYTASVSYIF